MYSGDSSIGNYRGVLAVEASKIPVNIQVERINLNKVVQSFTSCIQLKNNAGWSGYTLFGYSLYYFAYG